MKRRGPWTFLRVILRKSLVTPLWRESVHQTRRTSAEGRGLVHVFAVPGIVPAHVLGRTKAVHSEYYFVVQITSRRFPVEDHLLVSRTI